MSVAFASVPPHRGLRLCAGLLAAMLGGCHDHAPAQAPTTATQARLDVDGEIQWRGAWPCADCDGIDAQLVLRRLRDQNSYSLAETYHVSGQGTRFMETGNWRREGALLRLRGDAASVRVYALLPDGRLQARDAHGAALPGEDGEILLPVSATQTR
jgi:hypothetical protein